MPKWICVEINGVFYESIKLAERMIKHTERTIKNRCLSDKWDNYQIVPFRITYTEKRCNICGNLKPLSEFSVRTASKDGFCYRCRQCDVKCAEKWNKDHPEYSAKQNKEWNINNTEHKKEYNKEWTKDNPEYHKKYRNNKDVKNRRNKNRKEKRKNDPAYKLNSNMSKSIWASLKNGKDGKTWEDLVGWTVKEGRAHLESLFTKGMSWDNYGNGKDKWNLDHIIAICHWNITSTECQELRDCWALKNLQPLWDIRNKEKGDKPMHPKYLIKPDCIK